MGVCGPNLGHDSTKTGAYHTETQTKTQKLFTNHSTVGLPVTVGDIRKLSCEDSLTRYRSHEIWTEERRYLGLCRYLEKINFKGKASKNRKYTRSRWSLRSDGLLDNLLLWVSCASLLGFL